MDHVVTSKNAVEVKSWRDELKVIAGTIANDEVQAAGRISCSLSMWAGSAEVTIRSRPSGFF